MRELTISFPFGTRTEERKKQPLMKKGQKMILTQGQEQEQEQELE